MSEGQRDLKVLKNISNPPYSPFSKEGYIEGSFSEFWA